MRVLQEFYQHNFNTLGNPFVVCPYHQFGHGNQIETAMTSKLQGKSPRQGSLLLLTILVILDGNSHFVLFIAVLFSMTFFKMPHFGNAPFPNEILGLQLPLGSVLRNALFLTSIYNCLSLVLISSPLGSLLTPTVIGKGSRLPLFFIRFRVNPGPQGQRTGSSADKTFLV